MPLEDVEGFLEDASWMSTKELTRKYNISERTARRWKSRYRNQESFPVSTTEVYDQFARIKSDRTLIIGDIECPDHDSATLERALSIAERFELDTLIINGDLIALDSFSTWIRSVVYKLAFKEELEPTLQVLKVFLSHFPRIFVNTGNHERRLGHRVNGEISIGDFFSSLTGVNYSEYAYCYLESGGKEILVAHPDGYSRRPLWVPSEICAVKHMNVITSHSHHLAQGRDRSGKYFIVEAGSARDPERTFYKASRCNSFPAWSLGFCFVLKGVPFLVDEWNFPFYMGEGVE